MSLGLKVKMPQLPKTDKALEMGLQSNLEGVSSLSQDPVSRMVRRNTRVGVVGRKIPSLKLPAMKKY